MTFRLFSIAILLACCQSVLAAQGGREHVIPLFMGSDDELDRQGFMRVINHSAQSGTVEILGYDDAGTEYGPIELTLEARETQHFNSDNLEDGDASKGLEMGLGNGTGFWRLVLSSSTLDIEPLAYFRNKNSGFLASIHDLTSEVAMGHRVAIFNPTNPNQVSQLRVINLGAAAADVTITGLDDAGEPGAGSVSLAVPANGAILKSAAELEDEGLGDGAGKWSLNVASDQPIQVMSLMDVPGGYLSNLSGAKREYRGAAGLWRVTFDDGMGGDGLIMLLSDSRLYAWLPETADSVRIARGIYNSDSQMVDASGVVYESGKFLFEGFPPNIELIGGSDSVTLTAQYRSADWIKGEYIVAGESARAFHGWAFTGFERGASTAEIVGHWSPLNEDSDVPAEFTPDAAGEFDGALTFDTDIGPIECGFTGSLGAINPAFNVFESAPTINCEVLTAEFGFEVEMIFGVMDSSDMPGAGDRAIVLAMLPGEEEIGLGAIFHVDVPDE